MKKILLGAAALMAICAPGAASAATGQVDASYNSANSDFTTSDIRTWSIGGEVAFGGPVGVQLDGRYANIDSSGSGNAEDIGAHVYSRNETSLFGAYGGYQHVDGSGTNTDAWVLAAEGAWYMDRSTLSGNISYGRLNKFHTDSTGIDARWRFFPSDNFSLAAGAGYARGQLLGVDVSGWRGNLGLEYQFEGSPFSISAGYRYERFDVSGGGSGNISSWGIGAHWSFGSGSLFARDRSGAGLDHIDSPFERLGGGFSS